MCFLGGAEVIVTMVTSLDTDQCVVVVTAAAGVRAESAICPQHAGEHCGSVWTFRLEMCPDQLSNDFICVFVENNKRVSVCSCSVCQCVNTNIALA